MKRIRVFGVVVEQKYGGEIVNKLRVDTLATTQKDSVVMYGGTLGPSAQVKSVFLLGDDIDNKMLGSKLPSIQEFVDIRVARAVKAANHKTRGNMTDEDMEREASLEVVKVLEELHENKGIIK